jgi:hypothetical protein
MQEFSSVTASSYDADALTPLLNGKAAEGWSVVSIVSAGTNIVAYLSRDTDGSALLAAEEAIIEEALIEDAIAEVAVEEAVFEEAVAEQAAESPAPYIPAATGAVAAATTATDEAAGWATAPGEAVAATPVAEEPAAAAVVAPVEPAPVAEPTVPAGWYADPSGRFELRYWDGTAWTEHVSRAGQQFTDPPVA